MWNIGSSLFLDRVENVHRRVKIDVVGDYENSLVVREVLDRYTM